MLEVEEGRARRPLYDMDQTSVAITQSMDRDLTHRRSGKPPSSDEESQNFSGSRNTHVCWEADCRNYSEVYQPLCVSFYMVKNTKII